MLNRASGAVQAVIESPYAQQPLPYKIKKKKKVLVDLEGLGEVR